MDISFTHLPTRGRLFLCGMLLIANPSWPGFDLQSAARIATVAGILLLLLLLLLLEVQLRLRSLLVLDRLQPLR